MSQKILIVKNLYFLIVLFAFCRTVSSVNKVTLLRICLDSLKALDWLLNDTDLRENELDLQTSEQTSLQGCH